MGGIYWEIIRWSIWTSLQNSRKKLLGGKSWSICLENLLTHVPKVDESLLATWRNELLSMIAPSFNLCYLLNEISPLEYRGSFEVQPLQLSWKYHEQASVVTHVLEVKKKVPQGNVKQTYSYPLPLSLLSKFKIKNKGGYYLQNMFCEFYYFWSALASTLVSNFVIECSAIGNQLQDPLASLALSGLPCQWNLTKFILLAPQNSQTIGNGWILYRDEVFKYCYRVQQLQYTSSILRC